MCIYICIYVVIIIILIIPIIFISRLFKCYFIPSIVFMMIVTNSSVPGYIIPSWLWDVIGLATSWSFAAMPWFNLWGFGKRCIQNPEWFHPRFRFPHLPTQDCESLMDQQRLKFYTSSGCTLKKLCLHTPLQAEEDYVRAKMFEVKFASNEIPLFSFAKSSFRCIKSRCEHPENPLAARCR